MSRQELGADTNSDALRKTTFYPEDSIREHLIKMHGENPDGPKNSLEKRHQNLHKDDRSARDKIRKRGGEIASGELLKLTLVEHYHNE